MKKVVFPVSTDFDMQLPFYFSGVGCFYEQENIGRPEIRKSKELLLYDKKI